MSPRDAKNKPKAFGKSRTTIIDGGERGGGEEQDQMKAPTDLGSVLDPSERSGSANKEAAQRQNMAAAAQAQQAALDQGTP